MEKEAYNRARIYDTETIRRQETEIVELRKEHEACAGEIKRLKKTYEEEVSNLYLRIAKLERTLPTNSEDN